MPGAKDDDSDDSNHSGSEESSLDPEEAELEEKQYYWPKYWLAHWSDVVPGAPISLDAICGTYHWFYEIPAECYGDPSPIEYSGKGESPGHVTLSIPADSPPNPQNLSGDIDHFGKLATFTGLTPIRNPRTDKEILNSWNVESMQWKKNYGDSTEEGNELIVLEAKDDDGHPFIMFRYGPTTLHGGIEVYHEIDACKEAEGRK